MTANSMLQQRSVTVGRNVTTYLESGTQRPSEPTVVLLHDGAWGASSAGAWGQVMALLGQDGPHILAPDMLGFGHTAKAVELGVSPYLFRAHHVMDFVAALGITEPVHIVGTSFGGSVALRLLSLPEHLDRIASVTSISGTGGPWRTDLAKRELGRFDGTRTDMVRIVNLLTDDGPHIEPDVARRMENISLPGAYAATVAPHIKMGNDDQAPTARTDNWPQQLDGVDIPITIITGSRDNLVEPDWTEHFQVSELGLNVTVELLDCKHSPNVDMPTLIAPRITKISQMT